MNKFVRMIALGALWMLFAASSFAQDMRVTEKVLPNGLKVLLKEEHKAPVVTFQVWYKVGSRNEKLGTTGMSHLLEHMMFKGTKKYGPKTFSQTVQRNGGNDNAFTGKDYTAYFETFAADRISISLDLESDRMQNLLIDPKEFEPERKVVMEERRMRTDDDPTATMVEQMTAEAFIAHPYEWPVIGWMSDIGNITRDDLYNHYRMYYAPNNATIVVVGDFDTRTLLPQIEKYFGRIPRGPATAKVAATEPKQLGERRIVVKKQAELPAVFVGYHTHHTHTPGDGRLAACEGFYEIMDFIRGKYPQLICENWMNNSAVPDYGVLQRHHMQLIGDAYNAFQLRQMVYGHSQIFPLDRQQRYIRFEDSKGDLKTLIRSGSIGGPCTLLSDLRLLSDEKRAILKGEIEFYKKLRHLLATAKVFRLIGRPHPMGWDAFELYDSIRGEGIVYAFRNSHPEARKVVALRGLEGDRNYKVTYHDRQELKTLRGHQMIAPGIIVELENPNTSEIILFSRLPG